MKLEDIGFYTLSDTRADLSSAISPLYRCELIVTSRCNFNCPYCRGVKAEYAGDIPFARASQILTSWLSQGLKNVRFSGGEPTLYAPLEDLVCQAKSGGCEHIAVSTNGSADYSVYDKLLEAGVNDFSISLDACCSSTGQLMSGRSGAWEGVVSNIQRLSRRSYVTVGVVLTPDNVSEVERIVSLSAHLGVSDIRIIPAAQCGRSLGSLDLSQGVLASNRILNYRYNNIKNGKAVRGLSDTDSRKCPLVLDDMAVIGKHHYPCIIYLREQGMPIGEFTDIATVRRAREQWFQEHDCFKDPICRGNCLDVCVDYNNSWIKFRSKKSKLPRVPGVLFDFDNWGGEGFSRLGLTFQYDFILESRALLHEFAVGWCPGEDLVFRPKENQVGLLFEKDGETFWFHLRNNEFYEVFCV